MKIGIISVNPTIGDWQNQLGIFRRALNAAKEGKCELCVFPELSIGLPGAGDLYFRPDFAESSEHILAQISPMTAGMTVIIGAPLMHEGRLYNTACVFHDGLLVSIVPKRYPKHTVLAEERWFARWDQTASELHLGAKMGSYTQKIEGLENLEIIVGSPSLSPTPADKAIAVELNSAPYSIQRYRNDLTARLDLAQAHSLTWIRANLLGCHDGTVIYDGGGYILNGSSVSALSPRFVIDQDFILTTSEDKPSNDFDPSLSQFKAVGTCPQNESGYVFAELELALCLGLHDYLRRAHISRLCLALSGGRDSAMIAVIAARLNAIRHPNDTPEALKAHMKDFLVTAYLPSSASSSQGTQKAALALAEHFGFDCPVIPIADLSAQSVHTIEEHIGRRLTWEQDDLTLQNVQARTRSTVIWTLANAADALLLTTGNMSEAAMGYATMDGDSSGCLDPIGNLPKTIINEWLAWAADAHKIEAIASVFAQPPSAELRPLETRQADEDDLMPYAILDRLMEWFIVGHLTPKELFRHTRTSFPDFCPGNDEALRGVIIKFVRLFTRSQWKRCRFANSFLVMPYDLSPASGLRWPCLQDAFKAACDEV